MREERKTEEERVRERDARSGEAQRAAVPRKKKKKKKKKKKEDE